MRPVECLYVNVEMNININNDATKMHFSKIDLLNTDLMFIPYMLIPLDVICLIKNYLCLTRLYDIAS